MKLVGAGFEIEHDDATVSNAVLRGKTAGLRLHFLNGLHARTDFYSVALNLGGAGSAVNREVLGKPLCAVDDRVVSAAHRRVPGREGIGELLNLASPGGIQREIRDYLSGQMSAFGCRLRIQNRCRCGDGHGLRRAADRQPLVDLGHLGGEQRDGWQIDALEPLSRES